MPFIYDEENVEWPADAGDDYEPPPPFPEQFEYLSPPDFGGAREPVRFSESASPKEAARHQPRRALRERAFLWLLGKVLPGAGDPLAAMNRQEKEAAQRRQRLFAVMLPALRNLGGQRIQCHYDGGNDEGFAWFGSMQTAQGRLSLDETCQQLVGTGLMNPLKDAGWVHEHPANPRTEGEHLREILEYSLPEEWAVLLLGWGFGTGPFSMYGALTVDLKACTITDDRDAAVPENGNILIGGRD